MELSVAVEDLQKSRMFRDTQQKEIDRLTGELGKKMVLAQANLKKIIEQFREQTNAAIQVATTTTLQGWSEQAADLQALRADKANWDLRGPGFWKLDKADCEAVQKNPDFMRIALTHREEIKKLLEQHDGLVRKMHTEMEAVEEPVVPTTQGPEASDGEEEENEEPAVSNTGI
jgi:hypothetical protein